MVKNSFISLNPNKKNKTGLCWERFICLQKFFLFGISLNPISHLVKDLLHICNCKTKKKSQICLKKYQYLQVYFLKNIGLFVKEKRMHYKK